jgi:hypothetical protein
MTPAILFVILPAVALGAIVVALVEALERPGATRIRPPAPPLPQSPR